MRVPASRLAFFATALLFACSNGDDAPDAGDGGGGDAGMTPDGGGVDTGTPQDAGNDADNDAAVDSGAGTGSAGCGMAASIATGEWVEMSTEAAGASRVYFVYLPDGYDSSRAYPVVYQFHGCSNQPERENNNVPVQNESGSDAIHVRGRAAEDCWDSSADGTGVALFDVMVAEVEASYCADPSRRFATGYSSGSFMSHSLACSRGDVLRGVATIAGGQGGRDCAGTVAALLIHDGDDGTVPVDRSITARDAHLERNGCDVDAPTEPTGHPPCVEYTGCPAALPVVWCQTADRGHSRQDALAAPAFWDFLSGL